MNGENSVMKLAYLKYTMPPSVHYNVSTSKTED